MDNEKKRIANEIKLFLAAQGIDRGEFAQKAGLGKSTVDKLLTGLYSDKTLAKVTERTGFRLKTMYASKLIGSYSKANWEGYIGKYIILHPSLQREDAIEASIGLIDWNDTLPGLTLCQLHADQHQQLAPIGALWIPRERSPLIYIQPTDRIGVRIIVATMVGERCMRGLLFSVQNIVANAWIPAALPIILRPLSADQKVPPSELGQIEPTHNKYAEYDVELKVILERQYGRFLQSGAKSLSSKKRLN